jgi:hypothetical protein
MGNEFQDGILPSGSFEITILETGALFIADNFSFDTDAALIRSKSASGRLARQKAIEQATDGSADIQLADASTVLPKVGYTFACDADKDGVVEGYMVTKPGRSFKSDDEYKAKMGVARLANPLIYGNTGKTTAELIAGLTNSIAAGAIGAIDLNAYVPPDVVLDASPFSATGLPPGIALTAATGGLAGTPTLAGTYYPVIKCSGTFEFIRNGVLVSEVRAGVRCFKWTITA